MFDFVTHDDWRVRLMDRVYRRLSETNKGKRPDYETFRDAVGQAWADVLEGIELRFFTGIQTALIPNPPEDAALWEQWENTVFDQRGQPTLLYDPDFEKRFLEHLVDYGIYESIKQAGLYLGMADRYCKRGEWMIFRMADMWLELPVLADQEIRDFHQRRTGEVQLSLLGALDWE